MNYLDLLKQTAERCNSIVCMGMDPVIQDIPVEGPEDTAIITFYTDILNKIIQKNIWPGAVKPNIAFYAQYGIKGLEALIKLTAMYKDAGLPVILDVKRGDIGKTAGAYAREAYEVYQADAVTLAPYMGYDSIGPFVEPYPEKGAYILTRTSNPSAGELQNLQVEGCPLYAKMADTIVSWYKPGMGSVVGATAPEELKIISETFSMSGKEIPLLIPGVGTQGGSASEIMKILKATGNINIHRINSSSGINYAYKKKSGMNYADAAVEALDELNSELGEART